MLSYSKKAQMNMGGIIMGVLGAAIGLWMASRMNAGIGLRIVAAAMTGVICYFMASFILNQ